MTKEPPSTISLSAEEFAPENYSIDLGFAPKKLNSHDHVASLGIGYNGSPLIDSKEEKLAIETIQKMAGCIKKSLETNQYVIDEEHFDPTNLYYSFDVKRTGGMEFASFEEFQKIAKTSIASIRDELEELARQGSTPSATIAPTPASAHAQLEAVLRELRSESKKPGLS